MLEHKLNHLYNNKTLKLFNDKRFAGEFSDTTNVMTGSAGEPGRTDVIQLQLKIEKDGVISDVRYLAHGSSWTIAASAFIAEQIYQKNVKQLEFLSAQFIISELHIPKTRHSAALLAEDALSNVLIS